MSWLTLGVLAAATIGIGYQFFQLAATVWFFRTARREAARQPRGPFAPPVTILKPLKGPGIDLYANLASFCRQDYPTYQIIFGVTDPADPALAIVQRLQRDFSERDIVLAVGDAPGANRKVANLRQMMVHAKHDVLVMSDADIRVGTDYLRTMVAPLADAKIGLTTCLYRGVGLFGLPSVIESLTVNTDFMPMVLADQVVETLAHAYGASIALKRAALDKIGGFAPLADHLADDYELGNRVYNAGYRLLLLPYIVETVLDSTSLRDVWRHQLRWGRTYRVCRPISWFASVLIHTVSWGLLTVLVTGGSLLGWGVGAAALASRLGCVAAIMRYLGDRSTLRHLWLVPIKDVGYTAVWAMAFLGRHVNWGGTILRVHADGRMTPVRRVGGYVPSLPERSVETTLNA